jgi:beta-lactamase class A
LNLTINRRAALAGAGLWLAAGCASTSAEFGKAAIQSLEDRSGGRLGVFFLEARTGRYFSYRGDERFSMCSTFKMPLAAIILREAEAGRLDLEHFVPFTRADIVANSVTTERELAKGGMSVAELAEAAQVNGDNTAANLLLDLIGGPKGFTMMLRSVGDTKTRLDRNEPEVNLGPPGEVRDTTTPRAMARLMETLILGDVLTPDARERMISWMVATRTGLGRIRAGLPTDWRAGDKTGSGIASVMVNKYNDIAIAWPDDSSPIIVTAYFEASAPFEELRDEDEAVLAEVGRLAASWACTGSQTG